MTLESELNDLGRVLLAEPAPDLVPEVAHRIALEPARRPGLLGRLDWRRPWVRTLSVVLALSAGSTGVLAGSASARERVADFLNIPGISITHAPAGAKPAPQPSGGAPFLGQPVSLAEAQAVAPFTIAQPTLPGFGAADGVYVLPARIGSVVSLTYAPRPGLPATPETGTGLLVSQFKDSIDAMLFKKIIYNTAAARPVQVNGHQGVWIEGPHELTMFSADGNSVGFPARSAANSLVWQSDGVILRIESALPFDQALAIAKSVR